MYANRAGPMVEMVIDLFFFISASPSLKVVSLGIYENTLL